LIEQLSLALLTEALSEAPLGQLYADSLIHTLARHLIRHYTVAEPDARNFNGGLPGFRLRRVRDFIQAHIENDLSLDEIAEAAGLSPFHFARAFKRTTGLTPQQYLWQARIDLAKNLLTDSALPLVEISARSGFRNQSHFTTMFRRFTSLTPGAYRNVILG
ncbi:MAG: helix-turn-helix domain-containing protein, partial [Blastocatellia bacterium]